LAVRFRGILCLGILCFFGAGAILLTASDKKRVPSTTRGENQDLVLDVTLYDDPMLVKELLGNDLGGHYIVADVKIDPKFGKEVVIDRDDFQIRTEKDGEHTTPFAPSQVTQQDAVLVSQGKGPPAASPGMVLGGPLIIKGGPAADEKSGPEVKQLPSGSAAKKDDPLTKLLEEKVLPEKKTDQAVSGLLYFPMEKQKRKDLVLSYGPRENRITLRFK
jgi:hypothetical protein